MMQIRGIEIWLGILCLRSRESVRYELSNVLAHEASMEVGT